MPSRRRGARLVTRSVRRSVAALAITAFTPITAIAQPAAPLPGCTIRRVIDGDTFVCSADSTRVTVRLLGVDAPERGQRPYGQEATRFLQRTLPPGTVVRIERDVRERDRYGRLLAWVWTGDEGMLNEALLRAGLAVVDIQPPNVRHAERLRDAARAAREAGTGLWATPAFSCRPADYRRKRCPP